MIVINIRWISFAGRFALAGLTGLIGAPLLAHDLPNPVTPLDAGKLLGEDIDYDRQQAMIQAVKPIKSGDWELTFENGPEVGLYRYASTAPLGAGDKEALLSASHSYSDVCAAGDRRTVDFVLTLPADRFPIKGKAGSQQTISWVSLVNAGKPATPPKPQVFGMDELLGDLHQSYAVGQLNGAEALVICPTAKPWDGASKVCVRIGLKGFSRAYAYVCDAQ